MGRAGKKFLLAVVVLGVVVSNVMPVFADNTYDNYKYLFNTSAGSGLKVGPNSSDLSFKSYVTSSSDNTVPGIWLKFSFSFGSDPNANNPEYTWDHIAAPGNIVAGQYEDNFVFIIRSCDKGTTDNCIYSPQKYLNAPAFIIQPGANPTPEQSATLATIILRKIGGEYVKTSSLDVKPSQWGSTASGNTINVNFLNRPDQTVSIWYKASKPNNNNGSGSPLGGNDVDPKPAAGVANDPDIQSFGTTSSYFKIDEADLIKPSTFQDAQEQEGSQTTETIASTSVQKDALPACSMTGGTFGAGSFMGCIARLVYYVIYMPINLLAGLFGRIFDFFMGYSLGDEAYRAPFAVRGWQIVRDISNIFFIIILVWTGFATVFNIGSVSMKKVIPQLIINALLINFSLFGTRLIIDLSNITARVFYNTMDVCDGDCQRDASGKITNPKNDPTGFKPLSEKIVSSFNPQNIFNIQTVNPSMGLAGSNSASASLSDSEQAGYFIIITLFAALLMFFVGMLFWKTAFMFLGRVAGLYIAMIFAPFAVLTQGNMPLIGGIKDLGWKSWLKELTGYAMLAPVFVFFLYIVYAFMQSGFLKVFASDISGNASFLTTLLGIAVPFLIIFTILKKGVDIAKSMAGTLGNMAQEWGTKLTGVAAGTALGVASGGAALAGRGFAAGLKKTPLGSWAARNADKSAFARTVNNGLSAGLKGSWDFRNTGLSKTLNKGLGAIGVKGNDVLTEKVGLGAGAFTGGVLKIQKDRKKKMEDTITKDTNFEHLTDSQAKKAWDKRKGKIAGEAATDTVAKEKLKKDDTKYKQEDAEQTRLENLKKKAGQIYKDAKTRVDSGKLNPAQKAAAEKTVSNLKDRIDGYSTQINTSKNKQSKMVQALKSDKTQMDALINSEGYKKAYKEAEDVINKRHGEIKNGKDLSAAVRAEYVEQLLKSSQMIKNKKKRSDLPILGGVEGAGLAGIAGAAVGLGAALGFGGGAGGLLANYIDSVQQDKLDTLKKMQSDYDKLKGKGTKLGKLEGKLRELNMEIHKYVARATNQNVEDFELDNIKPEEQKKHIDDLRAKTQARAAKAKAEFDEAVKNNAPEHELTKKSKAKQEADDEWEALKNLWKDREKTESDIFDEKQKEKDKEGSKKEGDKDKKEEKK